MCDPLDILTCRRQHIGPWEMLLSWMLKDVTDG